jgi:tetratricopeptide (TPR) repeat protein
MGGMDIENLFVGRRDELKLWEKVLSDPQGQAVLVVGQQGMGKTMLVNKMAEVACLHPDLKCGFVRYEVTPTDPPEGTMQLIIEHAFEAAKTLAGSFDPTNQRLKQWLALFNLLKLLPAGENLIELAASLRYDPQKHTRDQFINRLELISKRMPENGRAIFVIDPEKYMPDGCADTWRLVVKNLPAKIKFLFAQRGDDQLTSNRDFHCLHNVRRIPHRDLDVLDVESVEILLDIYAPKLKNHDLSDVRKALAIYNNHPYAIPAALAMLADGLPIEQLPRDPTPECVAASQWERVCQHGPDAIKYFRAFAVLQVAVPDDVTDEVSQIDSATREYLLADPYIKGLLRFEPEGRRIYHSLLADHILSNLSTNDAIPFHRRAVDVYRRRLKKDVKPDVLSAIRLPEHVLIAEGNEAFVSSVIDCSRPLNTLGLFDTCIVLINKSMPLVLAGASSQSVLFDSLGLIYRRRGDLDLAEEMHHRSFEINEKLGCLEGMASNYCNLALIYHIRGDLDQAEKMHYKALEIYEKLGGLEGMARQYGNLCGINITRGNLDQAELMIRRSLEINEKLGCMEGRAAGYGNLGLIYQKRGNLELAKEMYQHSLQINIKLGCMEGMAAGYGNLGVIYSMCNNLNEAEKMLRQALEIENKIGCLEGIAHVYGNLGSIFQKRGDLEQAKKMHLQALETYEKFGGLEGMADVQFNIGHIFKQQFDFNHAQKSWEEARELYNQIGIFHMVVEMNKLLKELPPPD